MKLNAQDEWPLPDLVSNVTDYRLWLVAASQSPINFMYMCTLPFAPETRRHTS
jgi:hypothetical protein